MQNLTTEMFSPWKRKGKVRAGMSQVTIAEPSQMNDALPTCGKMADALWRSSSEHDEAPQVGSIY